ncbi:MAG: TetR/AcrR family transcriptional regulator [Flavobacteriales bacterium]|nr:TetR/AcrR family transcriptional regulator [Flavobacteriales bacterium]
MIPRGKIKDKRKAILDSSLELIALQGFHGTSMKQVADNAGVAAGTIYVYFENKDVLIHELFVEIKAELNETIVDVFISDRNFKENFIIIWNSVLDYYLEFPLKFNFLEQFSTSPYINDLVMEEGLRVLAPAHSLFEDAREEGVVKDLPTLAIIALIHGPIISLVRMNNVGDIVISKEIDREKFSEASWNSISV